MSEDYKELLQKYDLLAKQYENLKTQYLTVLDLAKKNSDAYEYSNHLLKSHGFLWNILHHDFRKQSKLHRWF